MTAAGLAPLAPRYGGFIVDLWGCLHNGLEAFPAALECLAHLRGKRVLLLSNAPRRAEATRQQLRRLGVADTLYTDLLTSGEATHRALRDRTDPWFAALGARVLHIGPDRDRNVITDLPLTRVAAPQDADFVLNTGPDDEREGSTVGEFMPELEACRAAGLPMICANPDLVVMRGAVPLLCAGALAEAYEALGGAVRWIGKPHPEIYALALRQMGMQPHQVLAIGDSLRTDIAGAAAADIDSVWVLNGISNPPAELAHAPVATLPELRW